MICVDNEKDFCDQKNHFTKQNCLSFMKAIWLRNESMGKKRSNANTEVRRVEIKNTEQR